MKEERREEARRRALLRQAGAGLLTTAAATFVIAIWAQDARWAMTGLVLVGLAIVSGLAGSE